MTTTQAAKYWDERIARETREEAQQIADFKAKLGTINLPGWTFDPEARHIPTFTHTESGAQFYVTMPCRYGIRNGKVEAAASWPKDQKGQHMGASDWGLRGYGEADIYRIGFAFGKSAKAIASDLKRRLIPQLLEGMAIVNAKIEIQSAALDLIDSAASDLSIVFKTSDVREKSYYAAKVYFDGGSARISNHGSDGAKPVTVALTLDGLTVAQAGAIAALLNS